jgi:tRNA pseudouridine55 synthase
MAFDFYNGEVLLINKPYTWSSFQAVNKIKHAIKNHSSLILEGKKVKPKVGHAGTLDPLATGLLIVCSGKKTKKSDGSISYLPENTGCQILTLQMYLGLHPKTARRQKLGVKQTECVYSLHALLFVRL